MHIPPQRSSSKKNVGICGNERPSEGNQLFIESPNVMVWCAVTREKVIGPYFFEGGNVDGEKYRNMLIHYVFPRFATMRQDYIFQQDGASAQYSSRARNYLDNKRPNNCIERADLLTGLFDLQILPFLTSSCGDI